MRAVELAARLLLALVFVAAVVGKLRTRAGFAEFVGSVGQFGVPARWASPVARLAVAAEAAVVALLAVPATAPAGLVLAAGLLGVLTAAIVGALRRGARPACRCFGAADAPIGPRHVARNLALTVVALLGLSGWATAGPSLPPAAALLAAGVAVPLAAVVVRLDDLVALFAPASPRATRPAGRS
ncbi:MauE/DoxX family redox-associated membrane protein [Micromonospora avicenniae]|uniref:Methylamine utilisation protein MauE n=1 Tax=Micromonospora avicenniae TaxID=1198245 RepID=A0A1N7DJW1_9ACTN|nr:MauE/DoxX family redox-associated membrane protein [Micromonospora avicenniae]SIR76159.1 Methylamine utilisation protein MauE [Micromonospora avicenniae]